MSFYDPSYDTAFRSLSVSFLIKVELIGYIGVSIRVRVSEVIELTSTTESALQRAVTRLDHRSVYHANSLAARSARPARGQYLHVVGSCDPSYGWRNPLAYPKAVAHKNIRRWRCHILYDAGSW